MNTRDMNVEFKSVLHTKAHDKERRKDWMCVGEEMGIGVSDKHRKRYIALLKKRGIDTSILSPADLERAMQMMHKNYLVGGDDKSLNTIIAIIHGYVQNTQKQLQYENAERATIGLMRAEQCSQMYHRINQLKQQLKLAQEDEVACRAAYNQDKTNRDLLAAAIASARYVQSIQQASEALYNSDAIRGHGSTLFAGINSAEEIKKLDKNQAEGRRMMHSFALSNGWKKNLTDDQYRQMLQAIQEGKLNTNDAIVKFIDQICRSEEMPKLSQQTSKTEQPSGQLQGASSGKQRQPKHTKPKHTKPQQGAIGGK